MGKLTALTLLLIAATLPTGATAGPDCRCRAEGQFFNQGDLFCIRNGDGRRLVRCAMSQNVTTWDAVEDSCPTVSLTPLPLAPGKLAQAMLEDRLDD